MSWDLLALSSLAVVSFAFWLGWALAPWVIRWWWWRQVKHYSDRTRYIRANGRQP